MELKELTDRTLELFGVTDPGQLGPSLLAACGDHAFIEGGKQERIKQDLAYEAEEEFIAKAKERGLL